MATCWKWSALVIALALIAAAPAQAQVATLGKGWLLDAAGSITSVPGEVISGHNSIKGSGSSQFLITDPSVVPFAANHTYTITLSYRIIVAATNFGYGVSSSTEITTTKDFGSGDVITGPAGSSGTATSTFSLHNYSDYQFGFNINGTGTIVIDDIRITDAATSTLVASENAEGPALVPGPLNFQITDAMAALTGKAAVDGAGVKDLNGDTYPETILTLQYAPTVVDLFQPIIVEASGRIRIATTDFFPTGIPTTMNSPMVLFADVNGDGLQDIVLSDAGLDVPPFTGRRLGVALNNGNGTYRDVSPLIPADQWTNRAYATAVGDIYGDGKVEIVLPDEVDGSNPVLLRWNGNGFDEIRNWIPASIWKDGPALLHAQSWMNLVDFDLDGNLDLLVTGQDHNPNYQIVFGGADGFTAGTLVVLPDGPFGHYTPPPTDGTVTTQEVDPVVVADFDNDGRPDIFSTLIKKTVNADLTYSIDETTYNVRLNKGSRSFVDVSPTPYTNLGLVAFQNLFPIDINNDGFLDVVGTYTGLNNNSNSPFYGTTFFLNDGTGAFQVVDGANLLGATTTPSNGQVRNLGSFVPTIVTPLRTEGIVYESIGGCGVPGGCPAMNLNIYKVVSSTSIGTGPNFVDPATLGVPGFNEFYYLRHYPAAAAAVQAGQYASGLAHYLAVGASLRYQPHAPAGISPLPTLAPLANAATRRNGRLTLTIAVGDAVGGAAGVTVAAASSNPTLLPRSAIGVSGSGGTRTLTLVPAPNQIGTATITVFASARGMTTSASFVLTVYVPGPADYDGDRKTDIGVFRPATGIWYILQSTTNYASYVGYQWGVSTDVPLTGDYDGDGKADVAIYRPATGIWYLLLSTTNFTSYVAYQWGVSTDVPVPGDYDGDGKTDVAIYRPATGIWYILLSTTNATSYVAYQWGVSTDTPVPSDYDGDGKTDVAIYRPATGIWYVLRSSTNSTSYVAYQWGVSTDLPVVGDYDGDGKADVAVYRPATGVWYVLRSSTNSTAYVAYQWGVSTDLPVPADYDGDGQTDVAVFRPATGIWYVLRSSTDSTTYVAYQWGVSTDVPLVKP